MNFSTLFRTKENLSLDKNTLTILDDIKNGKDVSYLLQADGLHPNPAGVKVIVEYISPQILRFLRKEKIIQ